MITSAKRFLKKNSFTKLFVDLYVKFKYVVLNFLFIRRLKSFKKIELLGESFYYPKYSAKYNTYFKNFEVNNFSEITENLQVIKNNFIGDEKIILIDVGANLGYQSLSYSKILNIKEHLCFEPFSINYYYLEKNLSFLKNVSLFNFALGSQETFETISFPSWENNDRLSNLGLMSIHGSSGILNEDILVKKLDDLNLQFDDQDIFLKIDVEGYEEEVIKGAKAFIEKHPNLILNIELNPKVLHDVQNFNVILDALDKEKFNIYVTSGNSLEQLSKSEILQRLSLGKEIDPFFSRK